MTHCLFAVPLSTMTGNHLKLMNKKMLMNSAARLKTWLVLLIFGCFALLLMWGSHEWCTIQLFDKIETAMRLTTEPTLLKDIFGGVLVNMVYILMCLSTMYDGKYLCICMWKCVPLLRWSVRNAVITLSVRSHFLWYLSRWKTSLVWPRLWHCLFKAIVWIMKISTIVPIARKR